MQCTIGVHFDLLDCYLVACVRAEVVEELCDALLAIGVVSEGVNDPNL